MVTIKSYSDLEQSKKLAEILPLESADMHFINDKHAGCVPYFEMTKGSNPWLKGVGVSPCWSLASLLGVLPDYTLQTNTDGTVFVVCDSKKPMISDAYNNPVDACVNMILELNRLNML